MTFDMKPIAHVLGTRAEFGSRLSAAECKARLQEAFGPWWQLVPRVEFAGSVIGRRVSIRQRQWYGNSFQTIFVGRIEEGFGGTILRGRFRLNALVILFLAIGFGFMSFAALSIFISPQGLHFDLFGGALMMICASAGLVGFGRYLARNEARDIAAFICETLEASES